MPITRTPIIDDSGQGTDGTVIDNAWKQELYNQIDGVLGGTSWTTIPFSAANFPVQPAIEAHQVPLNQFTVINKTLFWMMNMSGAPGSGFASLNLVLPGGYQMTACLSPLSHAYDGGYVRGSVRFGNATTATVEKETGAVWTPGGQVYVQFTAILALV